MKQFLFLSFLLISCFACKKQAVDDSQTASQTEEISEEEVVEIEKDFVDFYNQFHEDSIFQLSAINFPLHAEGDSITWTSENWIMHKPFNDYGNKFRREFTPAGRIMLERIYDANGFFSMHRRWGKLSDGWKLIYYKIDEYKPPTVE